MDECFEMYRDLLASPLENSSRSGTHEFDKSMNLFFKQNHTVEIILISIHILELMIAPEIFEKFRFDDKLKTFLIDKVIKILIFYFKKSSKS